MEKSLKIKNGPTLVLKSLPLETFIKIFEKRILRQLPGGQNEQKGSTDLTDNGAHQILEGVVSPSQEQVLALFSKKPRLASQLWDYFQELAGSTLSFDIDEKATQEPAFVEKQGEDCVCFVVNGKQIFCRRFNELVISVLENERDQKRTIPFREFQNYGQAHVLPESKESAEKIAADYNAFYFYLGLKLNDEAGVEFEEEAKKK